MSDVAKHVPVEIGDTVVTRGSDKIFPIGIMVGVVSKVENDPQQLPHDHRETQRGPYAERLRTRGGELAEARTGHVAGQKPPKNDRQGPRQRPTLPVARAAAGACARSPDLANGWLVPYLYVLFLLMLPFELPDWAQLLVGFFAGMVMDLFSSTRACTPALAS